MQIPTNKAMESLTAELRALAPKRPLTYGESLHVVRLQAARFRREFETKEPEINLIGLVKQRLFPVAFVPSYRLHGESGLTTDAIDGAVQVFINKNEPLVRQRFSLLHEFKHVLDFPDAEVLHRKLGRGDTKLQKDMIEWLANEFAAQVLMPADRVARVWTRTKNLPLAANLFNVSTDALATRLEKLGMLGEPKPAPRAYFRRVGLHEMVHADELCMTA